MRSSACENGGVIVLAASRAPAVVLGSDFSDPTNERIILLSAAGLALVGVGLLIGTILWWRRGRQEHPALSPLEVMGSRAWAKAPEGERERRLEKVRLRGDGPAPDETERPEPVDLQALVRSLPQAFDDLREPGELADANPPPGDAPVASDVAVEPFVVASNGEVVPPEVAPPEIVPPAVADPDATSHLLERPLLPAATPSALPPPISGQTPVTPERVEGSEALASSQGDPT